MGVLLTTSSLNQIAACTGSLAFITGSLFTSGNQWYSGSNYEGYFEEGIVHPFTCSNKTEVGWIIWACDNFPITSSLYNKELNTTTYYQK